MNNYKIIIIGSQLSGKTTLTRYLRSHTKLNVLEMEEELMRLNNNIWPDNKLKDNVLVLRISNEMINKDSIIFLTSQFEFESLKQAKVNGFKIIELQLDKNLLLERNVKRIKEENYDDARIWMDDQLSSILSIKKAGLFDLSIDASKSVEETAREIQSNL